jgi:type IVB pilus formation R64 PilN family outer membrane protein
MRILNTTQALLLAGIVTLSLGGCAVQDQAADMRADATTAISTAQEKAAQSVPVVSHTSSAWLMGQSVQVGLPTAPILNQQVTYHPTQRVSLADVASFIKQATGVAVDTAEVQAASAVSGQASAPSGPIPSVVMPPLPASMGGSSGMSSNVSSLPLFSINYDGPLSGLLDVVANKAGLWWKFSDGRLIFYRTETKTFYLPAIARSSTGNSQITASSGSGGTGGATNGSTSGNSGSSSGGATSISNYTVDVWVDLEKVARTVGGTAQIVGNASVGSLTVTGTPVQIRHVEEWVKNLSDNLSQQVSITVHVYMVRTSMEDNYNWNPDVVFKSGQYALNLTSPTTPPVVSGLDPLNLTANILSTTDGTSKWTGSQLAYQALSTLGQVSVALQQTVVTLNGQPAPIQVANQLGYLASSTAPSIYSTTGVVVPPTLTPGTLTTGFTAMFLPRIVNGKILLAMNLTRSVLNKMGSVSSGGASIQTPNVDVSTFQQSVTLTPGDSLLLTGLQQDSGNTDKSGVGSANFFGLGGGVDSQSGKQLIAIVITAKVI